MGWAACGTGGADHGPNIFSPSLPTLPPTFAGGHHEAAE